MAHSSISLAAVGLLVGVAGVANGQDVAEKLSNDRDGRIAADNLAIVVAVDAAFCEP